MQNEQSEIKRDVAIRITMMPRDTNAHGTVFGGIILSYIDVAGGVEAVKHTRHDRFEKNYFLHRHRNKPVVSGVLDGFDAARDVNVA